MSAVWRFFQEYGEEILEHTYQHVYLTFVAVVVAVIIALPLGIYLTRCRWQRLISAVLGAASVIQTIPGLALVALIGLLFLRLREAQIVSLETVGVLPALVALVLYALLPILRNTYTGIRQVDPSVIEVATGMGMRRRQVLFSIELPLSLPVIMAGIRIATVWTIGIATLCSLIGGGGLGDLIFKGLRSYHVRYLLAGTLPAASLALIFDWILGRTERWLTPLGLRNGRAET